MNEQELTTPEQVRCILEGTEPVAFEIRGKDECYAWIERTLLRFRYRRLNRPNKGLVIRYLMQCQMQCQWLLQSADHPPDHAVPGRRLDPPPPALTQQLFSLSDAFLEALHGNAPTLAGRCEGANAVRKIRFQS